MPLTSPYLHEVGNNNLKFETRESTHRVLFRDICR